MRHILLHLSLTPQISTQCIIKLVESCKKRQEPLSALYQYSITQFMQLGIVQTLAERIVQTLEDDLLLERELQLLERHAISMVTLYDDEYPSLLKEIHVPPILLYVQGTLPQAPMVAFVGSRLADEYGHSVVNSLVPDLVASGVSIISGGALGIDTHSHQIALNHKGITAAVLGGGLLRPYPAENKKLFTEIVESGGALISPFALEQRPNSWQFPERNRIIAGMSSMTVVVQAAEKSGALITAEYALQEGRSVGAVPGPIHNPLSKGAHALLRQGASPITCAADILQECGLVLAQHSFVVKNDENVETEALKIKEFANIIEQEDPLLSHCMQPSTLSDLSLKMGVSELEVSQKLFLLQLDGKVEQDFAGLWRKVI